MKYARPYDPRDYADRETGKERRERLASEAIWFLLWVGFSAPFFSLFFRELTR